MIDLKICEWLMENADAPIRYRVAREFLNDEKKSKMIEPELFKNLDVTKWLKNLQSDTISHGSFDNSFENIISKLIQLGLHAKLPQIERVLEHHSKEMVAGLGWDIVISNFLSHIGIDDKFTNDFMLNRLDTMYRFAQSGNYNIYLTEEEKSKLKAIPKMWNDRKFIKREFSHEQGYRYPLIYDIVGLHTLYHKNNTDITSKVDTVIQYISTDEFHNTIEDGYGILIADRLKSGNPRYHSQGWDPKYPGWFDVVEYFENGGTKIGYGIPKLLFFAQYISRYPTARKIKWFIDLLNYADKYRTENGTYLFPAKWFNESQGYAVQGHHMSFGENKHKKNWCEIESTFYMQLLHQHV